MDILEQFIRLELEEGKKFNALALTGLGAIAGHYYGNKLTSNMPSPTEINRSYEQSYDDLMARMDALDKKLNVTPELKGRKPSKHRSAKAKDSGSENEQPKADSVGKKESVPDAPSYSKDELYKFVADASTKHDVPAAFIDAIIRTESNYNPRALSKVGAQGIMQIMPSTAKMLGLENPWDASFAIDAGAKHLKELLVAFDNDYDLAAAAYNAGAGNVRKYKGIPPFDETQKYVKRVKERMATSSFAQE